MLLLSFHIVSIAILVAVVGMIAYQMGKKEGIRITENYYEEQQPSPEVKNEGPAQDSATSS